MISNKYYHNYTLCDSPFLSVKEILVYSITNRSSKKNEVFIRMFLSYVCYVVALCTARIDFYVSL